MTLYSRQLARMARSPERAELAEVIENRTIAAHHLANVRAVAEQAAKGEPLIMQAVVDAEHALANAERAVREAIMEVVQNEMSNTICATDLNNPADANLRAAIEKLAKDADAKLPRLAPSETVAVSAAKGA